MNADRCAAACGHGPLHRVRARLVGQQRPDPVVGPLQRVRAGRLHGVDGGHPAERAQVRRLAQRLDAGAGQRSPADLDDQVIQGAALARQIGHELVAEGLAALDGQPVLRALGGERQRPPRQLLPQPQVRRVAERAGRARADDHRGLEFAQPGGQAGVGVGRDEHGQPPAAGPGHHGRGQGRVPAAGDGQLPAAGGVEQTAALHDRQVDEHAHQVAALVRARHVAGLVLDPHPAGGGEGQGLAQFRAAEERRGAEPVPVHGGDRRVERGDQVAVAGVGQAAGPGHVVGVHERAVAQERVRLGDRRESGPRPG